MSVNDRYSTLLDKCINSLTIWKKFINENLENQEKDTETAKLKTISQEYCIIDDQHERSKKALALVEEAVSDPSKTYSIDEIYQEKLAEQPVTNPTDHEIWAQLFLNDCSIQEVQPKAKKDKTQYEAVGDDSLMCSNSFTAPVDPITKIVIRKPLRNKKCKHVYDSETIYDYIRQSKSKAKCPYVGCRNNQLRPADLQEDPQLESQIVQYHESQQDMSTSESDSD